MSISDVQLKNGWYQVIDDNGKKIKEIHENQVGSFKSVVGISINFEKNGWLATYDKDFSKKSEKHI